VFRFIPAASVPVVTMVLLPTDETFASGGTMSEAGVGSDGRTTYVETFSDTDSVGTGACISHSGCRLYAHAPQRAVTYALGPSDYVENGAFVTGTVTDHYSEGCTFAGGATAGAAGACTFSAALPDESMTEVLAGPETLVPSIVQVFQTSTAAPSASTAAPSASTAASSASSGSSVTSIASSVINSAAPAASSAVSAASSTAASSKTNGAASGVRAGSLLSVVLGFAVFAL
jgi:hypothetical protein